MLSWASANRDPSVFEEPDALRLDRRFPKNHVGFGRGAHFCIGAHLARLEARLVVEAALSRTARIELDPALPAEPPPDPPVPASVTTTKLSKSLVHEVRPSPTTMPPNRTRARAGGAMIEPVSLEGLRGEASRAPCAEADRASRIRGRQPLTQ